MKKILLIRLSSIGDIVLTSLAIRCIRNTFPDIQIDFLTNPSFAFLVEKHLNVDQVKVFSSSIWDTAQEIVDEQYDAVFDLHAKVKTWYLQQLLPENIPIYRYEKYSFRRNISVFLKKNFYPSVQIPDQYLKVFEQFGVRNDGKGLEFKIPESDWVYRSDVPLTHRSGYAVLSLGATHFTKKLPVEKWQELIRKLNIPIILIGGKEEQELGNYLESVDELKVVNKSGQYNIGQSASVIAQSKFFITQDTGMMHIATALKVKVISIWGGTAPYLGFAPYGLMDDKNIIIQNEQLACRPCSKYGRSSCPKGHFKCMKDVDLEKIIQSVTPQILINNSSSQ